MGKRYTSIIILLFNFLLLSWSSSVCAQNNQLNFIHLTPDEGLSSSIITSIIQDQRGFIWIGTHDGLNRYDGLNFLVYKNDPADSSSLINDYVQTIAQDRDMNLLIGTEQGLALYDRKKDCFINYMSDKTSPLRGMEFLVTRIIEDSLSNLWLATSSGLIYFDRIKNRIIQYIHDPQNPQSISDNEVESILIDRGKRFWVATRRGLNLFHPESGTFTSINNAGGGDGDLSGKIFWSITEDREGDIWFGSNDGLYRQKETKSAEQISLIHYKNDPDDNSSLSINQVVSLFVDHNGYLWIGTENGGINLFDRRNNRFWHYRKNENNPQSLNSDAIQTIYQDRTGNMWFGTFTGGLNVSIKNRDAISSFLAFPSAPLSLSHNTVTGFLERQNGELWVGTDGGGLYSLNNANGSFQRFKIDNSSLSSNSVICMAEGSNDQIWLGTWAGGLVLVDGKSGRMTSFTTKNSGITDDNIFTILKGDNDDLWLGSYSHGLIRYQIKENRFTDFSPDNSKLSSGLIVKLLQYTNRRILIGTSENFQIYSIDDGGVETYTHDPKNVNSLSSSKVTDLLIENDTSVWIGTPRGLNRFNPVTRSFKRFYESDGLPNNFIKGLLLDNSGILWITTNKGICRFDYRNRKIKNFAKADGLLSNEFSERGVLKTKNGSLLAGTSKGFNVIYPEKITENNTIPEILITDFKVFNKSAKPGGKNSPLVHNITETKSLSLSYKQSVITIFFAVMDFSAPEKNHFAYKMEGFDDDWIYSGNKSEVTYTNLNPGEYTFRVKGSNNDGVWNETGTSVKVTVLPPWWLTWWFKLIVTCFVIIILASYYFFRINQLTKQKAILEKAVAIKTSELKELNASKDKFFSIIAHDLKSPFNTIIGFSDMLNEEIKTENTLKIKEFARSINVSAVQTFKLLENLLEWAKSQLGKIAFNPEKLEVLKLVEEEFLVLSDVALEKNINLLHNIDPHFEVLADKNMLRTILRNLISNGIKFTKRDGKVEVKATILGEMIVLAVRDNGIGMSEETMAGLFKIDANVSTPGTENEKGTGLGLFLCKEFVEKHGGKIWAESEPGKGSVFIIKLPAYTTN